MASQAWAEEVIDAVRERQPAPRTFAANVRRVWREDAVRRDVGGRFAKQAETSGSSGDFRYAGIRLIGRTSLAGALSLSTIPEVAGASHFASYVGVHGQDAWVQAGIAVIGNEAMVYVETKAPGKTSVFTRVGGYKAGSKVKVAVRQSPRGWTATVGGKIIGTPTAFRGVETHALTETMGKVAGPFKATFTNLSVKVKTVGSFPGASAKKVGERGFSVSRTGERAFFNPSHDAKGRFATKSGGAAPAAFEGEAIPSMAGLGLTAEEVTADSAGAIGAEVSGLILADPDPVRREWHAMAGMFAGEAYEVDGVTSRAIVARNADGRISGGIMLARLEDTDPVDVAVIFAVPKGHPAHVDGTGSALLGEAAKVAADGGVGVELLAIPSAHGFYKAKGMVQGAGNEFTWSPTKAKQIAAGLS